MFNLISKEIEFGGQTLKLETGKVARQANGAVMATMGDNVVLATVCGQKKPKDGIDFLPLSVHYREMAFSAGKIPGGFFKREGKPTEREVLISRLIDRPIRPIFPNNYHNETQIICTLLSYDKKNDPDILALIASSAALAISEIPITENIAAVRVGLVDGNFVLNPAIEDVNQLSQLNLSMAGTSSSILMVESEAKQLTEEQMLTALEFGHNEIKNMISFINEFAANVKKEKWQITQDSNEDLYNQINEKYRKDFIQAYQIIKKQERAKLLEQIREKIITEFCDDENSFGENIVKSVIKAIEKDIVRKDIIISSQKRIDGRKFDEVRDITTETSLLPRVHGSALFTRGETQALATVTLGVEDDKQIIDLLEGERKEHFLLHYNFPPYSVGESTMVRPPGRREIGHGKLAMKALAPLMPNYSDFPYVIRLVAEITESNGSSSMATVCSGSLAMMDAGIPLKAPVAGVAMGLILEGDQYIILSDILGDEDNLGDMDFKVAGTTDGVTALQMDIKINGITLEIMEKALAQAKKNRLHILEKMSESVNIPREKLSEFAPTITTIKIKQEKIREVIGTGGKVIRNICEQSGAKLEIEDDGTIRVAATDKESTQKALDMINEIVEEPEIDKIYEGKIVKILDFGVFMNFMGSRDGFVHISEICVDKIEDISEVLSEGDIVKAKVINVDEKGKSKLSIRLVDQETGEDLSGQLPPPKAERPKSNLKFKKSYPRKDNQQQTKPNNGNRRVKNENNFESRKYFD